MRRTTTAKLGAGLTAAALALTLGTGPATAEDAGSRTVQMKGVKPDFAAINGAGAAAKPGAAAKVSGDAAAKRVPTADITAFGQKSIILFEQGGYAYEANPTITNVDGVADVIGTRLTVGGANKGIFGFQVRGPQEDPDAKGLQLDVPGYVPVGKAKLGPTIIEYNDGVTAPTSDPTISSYFYIRRATYSTAKYWFEITRSGSKIKFKANSWKIFQPSTGKFVGIRSIKLQYRHSNGSFSTYKTMSLNTYGTGSYTKSTSTKRNYRLLISTTDSVYGNYSDTSPKI